MADWDVYAPAPENDSGEDQLIEEEEYFEDYDDYDDYDDDYYPPQRPQRVSASSFQLPPMKMNDYPVYHPRLYNRSKREDRLAYRHRTGDGIRKGLLNTGNDIEDALAIYNEDGRVYDTDKLRVSNADDLIPAEERKVSDSVGGFGSKTIIITKVRKGTLKKGKTTKGDIINTKVDMDPKHYWDHISHQLMEDGQFVRGKYDAFHEKAIQERTQMGIGNSPEMNSLYCFWCFYLREHFDQEMYNEFLQLAREDVVGGSHYGIECYFRFCSYGLEKHWDENIFRDFQNEAMDDYQRKSYYGLEKVQAFRINQKYDFEIPVRPDVARICAQFPTLRAFRERQAKEEKAERNRQRKIASSKLAPDTAFSGEKKVQPMPQPKSQPQPQPQPQPTPKQDQKKENSGKNKKKPEKPKPNEEKKLKQPSPPKPMAKAQPQPNPLENKRPNRGPRRGNSHRNMEFSFGRPQSLPADSPMRKRW